MCGHLEKICGHLWIVWARVLGFNVRKFDFFDSFLITYFSECKSRGIQNENGIGSFQRS